MLGWLTVELLIAAVIVVIACRMRQCWLGGALVFLLWPLFCWLVPLQDSMMYALPFVLGGARDHRLARSRFAAGGEGVFGGEVCPFA